MQFDEPIFVLGNPRSGTTLLRLMLNAHADICIPPECGFIQWWFQKHQNWSIQNNNHKDIAAFISDLQTSKKMESWKLDGLLLAKIIQENKPVDYAGLCAMVYYTFSIQQQNTSKYWGDKNNYYIDSTELLQQLYPRGKYIMIIRDGRDVAVSYRSVEKMNTDSVYKPTLPQSIDVIAESWKANNEKLLQFFNQSSIAHLIIRYEDLVQQPKDILQNICTWLGLSSDENMLQYFVSNKTMEDEPAAFLPWKMKTLGAPDPARIGQYKTALSETEINKFELIAFPLLSKFGYLKND